MKRKRMLALATACCLVFGQSGWANNVKASGEVVIEQDGKVQGGGKDVVEEETGSPVARNVGEITRDAQTVSLGGNYSGAITEDGSLYMWGYNEHGEIGNGTTTDQLTPVKVLSNVVSVSLAGGHYGGAITEDGSLYMWGNNEHGQIGNGTTTNQLTPTKILSDVVSLSLGWGSCGAITEDGSLYMWGYNSCGQIGNGKYAAQLTPTKVLSDVVSVNLSESWPYSGAITKDGSLYMWGENQYGQIGNGTTDNQLTPVKVLSNVSFFELGGFHSGAITKDGSLYMWGNNRYGQIGNGTTDNQLTPLKVLSEAISLDLDGLSMTSVAITENGSLYTWGMGLYSQIGTTKGYVTTPVKIFSNVVAVNLDFKNGGIVAKDGSLYMQGDNSDGQIGNGTNVYQMTPVKILSDVVSIELQGNSDGISGEYYSEAVTSDGSLYMWGNNSHGKIGNGTTTNQLTPIKVLDNVRLPGNSISIERPAFNEYIYRANYIFNNQNNFNFLYNTTPSGELYNQAEITGLSTGAKAWKMITDTLDTINDPSKLLDDSLTKMDFYEGIIFALFEEETVNSSDIAGSVKNDMMPFNDYLSTISDGIKADYGIEVLGNTKISKMSAEQIHALQKETENYFNANGFINISDKVSTVVDVIEVCEDIGEYFDYLYACLHILQLGEAYKEVLQDMLDSCPSGNTSLHMALRECVSVMNMSLYEFAVKMSVHAVAVAGKNGMKFAISKLWEKVKTAVMLSSPYAAAIWAGYKSGVYISDTLFNTSNISEKIINTNTVLDIKEVVKKAWETEIEDFRSSGDESGAEALLAAADICYRYIDVDCACAIEFVDAVEETLASKIRAIFQCDSNAAVKKQIKDIQRARGNIWHSLNTEWVRELEIDYPEEYEIFKYLIDNSSTIEVSKIYEIACPVDVYVYDENDHLVASVTGNKIYCGDDSEMTVVCEDNHKTLYFYDTAQQYTIQYVGTGEGTMDITVSEYGEEQENLRITKHINIPLKVGIVYTSEEDTGVFGTLTYQLHETGNGKEINPTTDTADASQKKYALSVTGGYIYDGDGISFSGEYYAGEKISIYANVPKNYTWLKWTSNNPQAVISDDTSTGITIIMPDGDVELTGNSSRKSETPTIGDKDSGTSSNETSVTVSNNIPGQTNNSNVPTKNSVHIVGALQYKVTKSAAKDRTVTVTKFLKKNQTRVVIPSTITIKGYKFKVTGIAPKVFQKCKKLRKIVIGQNVKSIGKMCFYRCGRILFEFKEEKAPKIGKKAFAGTEVSVVWKWYHKMNGKQKSILLNQILKSK